VPQRESADARRQHRPERGSEAVLAEPQSRPAEHDLLQERSRARQEVHRLVGGRFGERVERRPQMITVGKGQQRIHQRPVAQLGGDRRVEARGHHRAGALFEK